MSVADIVYRHVEKSKTDNIETVEIDLNIFKKIIFEQLLYKTFDETFESEINRIKAENKAKFNSVVLMPYFIKESEDWSKKIGVDIKYWSDYEHEKFKDYFMNKYREMVK